VTQRAGQFTSSKEKADIGLQPLQEKRIKNYLPRELRQPGNGSKIVNQSDGLRMEKEDMARNYGN